MWKFFVPDIKISLDLRNNNPATLNWLRNYFPKHQFAPGMHKGSRGVFVLKDPKRRIIGKAVNSVLSEPLEKDIKFWPPNLDEFKLEDFESKRPMKLNIKLSSGRNLKIFPACCEPKPVIFGGGVDYNEDPEASNYNKSSTYGKMAYDLFYLLKDKKDVDTNQVIDFVQQVLLQSYDIPLDIINYIGLVTMDDLIPIAWAGLGYVPDDEQLKKGQQP